VNKDEMKLRRSWTSFFAVGLLVVGGLWQPGILAAQETSAPPHPPQPETAATVKPAHGDAAEMRLERLSQQLNLTNEQKAKIRPVLRHEIERIMQVRSNTSLSPGETQRRIKLIRGDTHQRIGEFLTPEQKKQWQESSQAQRGGSLQAGAMNNR
jgi:protein CpxP